MFASYGPQCECCNLASDGLRKLSVGNDRRFQALKYSGGCQKSLFNHSKFWFIGLMLSCCKASACASGTLRLGEPAVHNPCESPRNCWTFDTKPYNRIRHAIRPFCSPECLSIVTTCPITSRIYFESQY